MNLAENGESYGLEKSYADLATLGMTADRAGIDIVSLCHLPEEDSGAELLLISPESPFGFALEVRPRSVILFLVSLDRNERFKILASENTPLGWKQATVAVLRLGGWEPREDWTKALQSEPIELGDLIVCV